MKKILVVLLITFSGSSFAGDCFSLHGAYRTKLKELLVNLTISGDNCESVRFHYDYGSGNTTTYNMIPDGKERAVFDDGRRLLKQKSEYVELDVGGRYVVDALKLTTLEYIGDELSHKEISYFFSEGARHAKTLVEKRQLFTADNRSKGTIYVGYVEN